MNKPSKLKHRLPPVGLILYHSVCTYDINRYIGLLHMRGGIKWMHQHCWCIHYSIVASLTAWLVSESRKAPLHMFMPVRSVGQALTCDPFKFDDPFKATVTTLRSPYVIAIPSVVCLLSVTLVHRTHRVELFVSIFAPHCTTVIWRPWRLNYDHHPTPAP